MSQTESIDLTLAKQRKLKLLRRKMELQRQCGIAFYKPHKKQDLFHKAAWARRRLFSAGNRTGKSHAGAAEDSGYFMGERLWYPKNDPARFVGIPPYPTKGLVVCPDWGKVDENFTGIGGSNRQGKLWNFLPPDFIVRKRKSSNGVIDYLEGKNGSIMRFETVRSFKQDAMSVESSDWDWVHYDEPVPKAMREGIARGGMDRGMKEWFTLTPRSELWIYDTFFPRAGAGGLFEDLGDNVFQGVNNRSWAVRASTLDNPYLSKEEIEDFIASLSPEELQCRIEGIPLELSGLVYKEFRYEKHVLSEVPRGWMDFNSPPPEEYVLYMSIDVHYRKPHAVLFCFVNPLEQLFFSYEIFAAGKISMLCELIKDKARKYRCAPIICDPLAWTPDPNTGFCMAHEFMRNGVLVRKASKAIDFGILQVKEALDADNYFHVSPNLKQLIYEFNNYSYDDNNKPKKEDDDMMEALYRLLINRPTYFEESEGSPISDLEIPVTSAIDPFEDMDDLSDIEELEYMDAIV